MDKHINAETLREELRRLCDKYNISFGSESKGFGFDLAALPDTLPAADVTVKSHGEWIHKDGVYTCPKCGYSFEHEGYTAFFNFCPCCGIVMNERAAKPKTNADVIREMTAEQLADFIQFAMDGDIDYGVAFCDLCQKEGGNTLNLDCNGCLRHWLNQSATEVFGLLYQAGGSE